MFTKILLWIRGVIDKMIGKQNVKQALNVDLAISSTMAEALDTWIRMYKNEADWINNDVKSLNLAAAISTEVAKSVTIEMTMEFSTGGRAKYLAEQFTPVMLHLRQNVEYGVAKGGLIFKPYIDGKNIAVDYVQADQFYPVEFDANKNLIACVFVETKTRGADTYTRLEYHAMEAKGCRIINRAYKSSVEGLLGQEIPLSEIEEWQDIAPDALIANVDRPLFAYFRYPMANNIDPASPLGVSCFSRAVDLIKNADIQWSNLLWEFESGQRALYLDSMAFGKDEDNLPILPMKRLYRSIDTGGANDALYQEWTPTLREANILAGLDSILKRIEFTCGLAYGVLSDPATVDKTATEIMISRQRTYATVVDTQKALEGALKQLVWAMDTWATIGKLAPAGKYEVAFQFDDSVIVDREKQFQDDLSLVGSQIMSKVEFRMRNFHEDETTAKKMLSMVTSETEEQMKLEQENAPEGGGFGG